MKCWAISSDVIDGVVVTGGGDGFWVTCGAVVNGTGIVVCIVEDIGVVGGTGWFWGGVVHPETSTRVTVKKIRRANKNGRDFSMHMSFLGFGYKTIRRQKCQVR
jgi:hypothetical protein